ncbi:MAG TPA: RHS repeat-associated core domain-containing protein [Verrucomicrobiae bacterium]|jgi:RHS repeat-associated protein
MALVNAADGTFAANYDYGPFGEPIRMTGLMSKNDPFRFSTKYDDDESDLLYYGYRYYKPSTGTWISRDPLRENGFMLLKNRQQLFTKSDLTVKEVTIQRNDLLRKTSGINYYIFNVNNSINEIDLFGLDDWSPDTYKMWKDLIDGLKDAWEVAHEGKCPKDPCYSVTSLSAPCHCLASEINSIAGKLQITRQNENNMISCICDASANTDCDRNARKVIEAVFGTPQN